MNLGPIFSTKWIAQLRLLISPKVVYIKDHKASGTPGGQFDSGAWKDRDLNTVTGDTELVTLNIPGKEFQINQAGKYKFFIITPAHDVDNHTCKLLNVSDTKDEIIGSATKATATQNDVSDSIAFGIVEIGGPKTFKIQHRGNTQKVGSGFGEPNNFGVDEVYTQVIIEQVG